MVDFLDNLITRSNGEVTHVEPRPLARYESLREEHIEVPIAEDDREEDVDETKPGPTQPAKNTQSLSQPAPPNTIDSSIPTLGHTPAYPQTSINNNITPPPKPPLVVGPIQSTKPSSPPNNADKAIQKPPEISTEKSLTEPLSFSPNETVVDSTQTPYPDDRSSFSNAPISNQLSEPAADPTPSTVSNRFSDDEIDFTRRLHTIIQEESTVTSSLITPPEPTPLPVEQISPASFPRPSVIESSSTIQVTIGRIEVRANQTAKPGPRTQPTTKSKLPVMSLADYLKTRNSGGGE